MLNAHPEMVAPPECGFIQWNHDLFKAADFKDSVQRKAFAKAVLESKKMETWGLDINQLVHAFDRIIEPSYQLLCEAVFQAYHSHKGHRSEASALIDKNNYYLDFLDEIHAAMPHAKYLHLVRDVRDVACSYLALKEKAHQGKYAPKLSSSLEEISKNWCANNEKTTAFLSDKNHFVVRYEDLLRAPEEELGKVCAFLGLQYHPQMATYYLLNDEPAETIGWKKKTLEPVDPKRAGAFRNTLDMDAQNLLWNLSKDTLEKFGYSA